jgi:uncharacterized lipoprotein NlpE involved in copper resistance
MKKVSIIVVLTAMLTLLGCNKGSEVSGRSMKSAYRSVSYIKDRLPTEMRIEFEVSFWTLRDEIRNKSDFLDEVGGKTPEELIQLGKALYQKRKNEGYQKYDQFDSWDQMITHYAQERLNQNKLKKRDTRDSGNSVIYKL